jgi:ribose-phosphate pyrophosphokinase
MVNMITFTDSKTGTKVDINTLKMYSDGTPMVKTPHWNWIAQHADTMTVIGGDMAQFVTAMFLVDAIHDTSSGYVRHLVLPYIPGARQDRSNPTGDVLFTLRSVADMINERGFTRVVVLDPHSPVATNIIENVVVFPLERIAKRFAGYDGIIAADKGGQDRAEQFATALDIPLFYGGKTRDVSTGRLTGFTLEDLRVGVPYVKNGHYLVVDDICDGGGTFNGLAAKIHEQGATADLFVSHGIFSKGTDTLLENYNTIYTTDSLAGSERNHVTVLAVVKEMENYNG